MEMGGGLGGGRWVWMDMLRKLETQKFGEGGPEGW